MIHQDGNPPNRTAGAIYVLDREGSRVVRYVRGRAVQVAGGTEPGSAAAQLNAGPTGRIYVTWRHRKPWENHGKMLVSWDFDGICHQSSQ